MALWKRLSREKDFRLLGIGWTIMEQNRAWGK